MSYGWWPRGPKGAGSLPAREQSTQGRYRSLEAYFLILSGSMLSLWLVPVVWRAALPSMSHLREMAKALRAPTWPTTAQSETCVSECRRLGHFCSVHLVHTSVSDLRQEQNTPLKGGFISALLYNYYCHSLGSSRIVYCIRLIKNSMNIMLPSTNQLYCFV